MIFHLSADYNLTVAQIRVEHLPKIALIVHQSIFGML